MSLAHARRLAAACAALSFAAAAVPAGAEAPTSPSLQPRVRFETTAGPFVLQLDAVRAPLTTENFLRYVRDGFYDGLVMHRVIANFVVQGGGYTPDLQPRRTAAPIVNESGNGLSNVRGSIGMARDESPHSATSQFYVNVKDNPGLNPLPTRWGYAVFGEVVEGMGVIDQMAYVPTGERAGFADTPMQPIVIERAFVVGEAPESTPESAPESPPESPADSPDPSSGESPPAAPPDGQP